MDICVEIRKPQKFSFQIQANRPFRAQDLQTRSRRLTQGALIPLPDERSSSPKQGSRFPSGFLCWYGPSNPRIEFPGPKLRLSQPAFGNFRVCSRFKAEQKSAGECSPFLHRQVQGCALNLLQVHSNPSGPEWATLCRMRRLLQNARVMPFRTAA